MKLELIDLTDEAPNRGIPLLMFISELPSGNYIIAKTALKINFFKILKNGDLKNLPNAKNRWLNEELKKAKAEQKASCTGVSKYQIDINDMSRELKANNEFFVISKNQILNLHEKVLNLIQLDKN